MWIQVHPPNQTTKLRMISVGDSNHVWALDTSDKLYMRQETSSPAFPEVVLILSIITFQTITRNRQLQSCPEFVIHFLMHLRAQAGYMFQLRHQQEHFMRLHQTRH